MGKWCSKLACSFSIGSLSNLLITRKGIKSRTFEFQPIRSVTLEIRALEHQKISYILTLSNINISKPVGQSWSNFMRSIDRVGGKCCIRFGVDWITTVVVMATKSSHWLIMRKMVSQSVLSDLHQTCRYPGQAYNLRWVQITAKLDHSLWCYAPLSTGKIAHRL